VGSNRNEEGERASGERPQLLQAAETLRSVTAACSQEKAREEPRSEEKISVFWRVFGGTILSIGALVVMTVYQQFSANLNDVRAAITHLNEVQADLVKKDDLNSRATALWGMLKEAGGEVASLKTRAALLDSQTQGSAKEQKEMHDKIEQLCERLAALEARLRVPVSPTVKVPGVAPGPGE
jgi:septal ring factor EnvC (AmiA/AmiB activator)